MGTITHSVFFKLKAMGGSLSEKEFLDESQKILSPIPGVNNFRVLLEQSPKNEYTHGFAMEFDNMDAYGKYNNHDDHQNYVKNIWLTHVEIFQEIDYVERV